MMPPGDHASSSSRCRCRRRNYDRQFSLHFCPPGYAFAGTGSIVDHVLIDQHGLVERESHGILFLCEEFCGSRRANARW